MISETKHIEDFKRVLNTFKVLLQYDYDELFNTLDYKEYVKKLQKDSLESKIHKDKLRLFFKKDEKAKRFSFLMDIRTDLVKYRDLLILIFGQIKVDIPHPVYGIEILPAEEVNHNVKLNSVSIPSVYTSFFKKAAMRK